MSSPTCFESRGGAPKPVIVKISSQEPADVIPPIGFNACYKDAVGSPYKCLSFAIVQSCADSSQITPSGPANPPMVYTPGALFMSSSSSLSFMAVSANLLHAPGLSCHAEPATSGAERLYLTLHLMTTTLPCTPTSAVNNFIISKSSKLLLAAVQRP